MDYQQTETIELRKVKPESDVVFQCGRNTLERKTINREQNACMLRTRESISTILLYSVCGLVVL
ncbi:hypothetical protein E3J74_01305 [Candidatus Bathyarchaeota archaeon]|nr:MAG: hypothetical protein E3J74_01305 [Candidatus Bathyarchaeota archaeon]